MHGEFVVQFWQKMAEEGWETTGSESGTLLDNFEVTMRITIRFMQSSRHTILTACALLLWGCGSSAVLDQTPGTAARSGSGSFHAAVLEAEQKVITIKQGDQVEITVWGYTEFNTKSIVNVEGVITVPLIGEVRAEGLTKESLIKELRRNLTEYVQGEPRITVTITSFLNQRISVLGAVTRQDNYEVTAEVSLIEILSTAGGADPEADLQYVKVLRSGRGDPLVVNLAWYIDNGRTEEIPKVRPGDTVFVPKRENFVRQFSDFLRDAVLVFGFFRAFY